MILSCMKGQIGFMSEYQKGSCFWFEIPNEIEKPVKINMELSSVHTSSEADKLV